MPLHNVTKLSAHLAHHRQTLMISLLLCADVPLRNYSLTRLNSNSIVTFVYSDCDLKSICIDQ